MLLDAKNKKYAIAAFNVENMEMCKSIIDVADKLKSPVILATSKNTLKYFDPEIFVGIVSSIIKDKSILVAMHLDHGDSFDLAVKCLKSGYTSIMIDGSKLDYIENINLTKKVCDICNIFDIPVEGELGAIGGKIGDNNLDLAYTKPETALDFVSKTKVSSLAVAIGTLHGVYKNTPKLDVKRLSEIKKVVSEPLVLHGASGLSEQQIEDCIENGICKINFATDLRIAYTNAIKQSIQKNQSNYDPKIYNQCGMDAVKEIVREKLITCNSIARNFKINPKLIVFDFDGIIVDSEKIFNKFWREAAKKHNLDLTYEQALELRSLDSSLARELFFSWFSDYNIFDLVRKTRKELMAKWEETNTFELKPNIVEAIKYLKELKYKVAIVSSSKKEEVKKKLEKLKIGNLFSEIICSKSISKSKPYPDIYYYVAKKYNIEPSEILVFEDSPSGVASAKDAGCNVVMIPDLTQPDSKLIEKIDLVIPNAKYIKNIFE